MAHQRANSHLDVSDEDPTQVHSTKLSGWRLRCVVGSVFVGTFLSFLDTTIIAVALPTISNQFNDYERSSWVFTAYLLTYMAFGIILARMSDIFGKKAIEVTSMLVFLVFSLGCALSKNMIQLIVFRALQGVGGSGLFSMTMVINLNIVDPKKVPTVGAMVSLVQAISAALGPVLGGAIAGDGTSGSWRWIFWLNLPIGGLALALLLVAWPRNEIDKMSTKAALASIDFLGAGLLLVFSILLVFALVEGGNQTYAWNSPAVIVTFVVSGLALVAFVAWQELISRREAWSVQGIFPLEVMKMRVVGSTILVTLLSGFVIYIAIVRIPERFQIVSGDSAVIAGLKFLPFMTSSAIGSFTAGGISQKRNLTSPTLVAATALQIVGYGLMSTLGSNDGTPRAIYGYQVLMGMGFGMSIGSATILVQINFQTRPEFLAATQGALTQARSLGGSIGLAIGVVIINARIKSSSDLTASLTPEQLAAFYKSPLVIDSFTREQQGLVSAINAQAFAEQMRAATYVVAAAFLVSLLTLERHPLLQPTIRIGGEGSVDASLQTLPAGGAVLASKGSDVESASIERKQDS